MARRLSSTRAASLEDMRAGGADGRAEPVTKRPFPNGGGGEIMGSDGGPCSYPPNNPAGSGGERQWESPDRQTCRRGPARRRCRRQRGHVSRQGLCPHSGFLSSHLSSSEPESVPHAGTCSGDEISGEPGRPGALTLSFCSADWFAGLRAENNRVLCLKGTAAIKTERHSKRQTYSQMSPVGRDGVL